MVKINKIPVSSVYPIRQPVLRPGRPSEECLFSADDHISTFHLGLFEKGQLVGVASYMNSVSEKFENPYQYQLRGMAVLDSHKGKGYGAALLKAGEEELKRREKHGYYGLMREIML